MTSKDYVTLAADIRTAAVKAANDQQRFGIELAIRSVVRTFKEGHRPSKEQFFTLCGMTQGSHGGDGWRLKEISAV